MSRFSNLKNKVQELNTSGVGFMEGREKADLPLDDTLHLDDFGFIQGESGEYAVISLIEHPKSFFFGGSVVTTKLKELEEALTKEEREAVKEEGIPVLFEKKEAKKGKRTYVTVTFFPGE